MEKSGKKSNVSARMMLSTAAILAIQAMPSNSFAQAGMQDKMVQKTAASAGSHIFIKIKDMGEKMSIVGFENGSPVYKNSKGEFFTVNAKTGDLSYIKPEEFAKFFCCIKMSPSIKRDVASGMATGKRLTHIKIETEINSVSLVGIDNNGNTLQKNTRGEIFYLDPVTGDMIFAK